MEILQPIVTLLLFPAGLFVMGNGLAYLWVDRKLVAQYQNRIGPRWFQPLADIVKLLSKEEIVPHGIDARLFNGLPLLALACALTAALYVPLVGLQPALSFPGDLIVTVYLLSVVTMSLALAGANTADRFSLIGAVRTLTQLFSYEAPFMFALLGPAIVAGSWQISQINAFAGQHWIVHHPTDRVCGGPHRVDGQAGTAALRRAGSRDRNRQRRADGIQRARAGAVPTGEVGRVGRRADLDRRRSIWAASATRSISS